MSNETIPLNLFKANLELQLRLQRLMQENSQQWLENATRAGKDGIAESGAEIESLLKAENWQELATLPAQEQARLEQVSTLFEQAERQAQAASAPAVTSPATDTSATVVDAKSTTAMPRSASGTSAAVEDANAAPAMPSSASDTSAPAINTTSKTSSPKPKAPQKKTAAQKTVSKTPAAPRTSQTRRGKGK